MAGGDNKQADERADFGNSSGQSYDGVISSKVHFRCAVFLIYWLNLKNCCVPEIGVVACKLKAKRSSRNGHPIETFGVVRRSQIGELDVAGGIGANTEPTPIDQV